MNKVLFEMFVSKCTVKFTIALFKKGSSYVTELVTHFIYSLSLYILQFNHFFFQPLETYPTSSVISQFSAHAPGGVCGEASFTSIAEQHQ